MATDHAVLFSADTIAEKVDGLAARIDRDHGDDGVVVIVVLKGAAIFAADFGAGHGDRDRACVSDGLVVCRRVHSRRIVERGRRSRC